MTPHYTTLLFDFDDTLFDFALSSREALSKTFEHFGLQFNDDWMQLFTKTNDMLWKAYELGKYTKHQILILRFKMMFDDSGMQNIDYEQFNRVYLNNISQTVYPFEGTYELCGKLSKAYDMYVITNSVAFVNRNRMKMSGMDKYFIESFISDEIGAAKPERRFFEYVLDNIRETDKSKILIIGDSLTSDISGGINMGIDTCWLNRKGHTSGKMTPTYEVKDYSGLLKLLG